MHEKRVVVGTKSVVLGICLSALKVHEWPNKRGLGQLFANLHHHLKKGYYYMQKSPRSVYQDGGPRL